MKKNAKNTNSDIVSKDKLMESYKNNETNNQINETSSQLSGIGGTIASLKGMFNKY
ncbi:MAG: hypothetical protein M1419_03715 [Bacteroidetes bacterium]|nr:hypothetical protein [Bacteroidota bacterium]